MDAINEGTIDAREEEILAQIEALEAQLRAVRTIRERTMAAKTESAASRKRIAADRGKKIKAIVLGWLASGPLKTAQIIELLSANGMVDLNSEADCAYIRATLRRTKDIKNTPDGWTKQ